MRRGFIIAAGRGIRLRPHTSARPKSLIPIGRTSLLTWTIERMRAAGCEEIVVIVGHLADMMRAAAPQPFVRFVENADYQSNNVLHSLMHAAELMSGPAVISYSDVWVEPAVYDRLLATDGDIVVTADTDWRQRYEGRTDHPPAEAEKVFFDPRSGAVRAMGKQLETPADPGLTSGEYTGLMCTSDSGTAALVDGFERISRRVAADAPFRSAREWRMANISDLLEELIAEGREVRACPVERQWFEIDTAQDLERLSSAVGSQRLAALAHQLAES